MKQKLITTLGGVKNQNLEEQFIYEKGRNPSFRWNLFLTQSSLVTLFKKA